MLPLYYYQEDNNLLKEDAQKPSILVGGGANQTGISVLFLPKQEIKVTRKEKISSIAETID